MGVAVGCSCCRRSCRGWGRRRCWRGCRTRCSGAVSPAGVNGLPSVSAPDDHFTAGPDCRVTVSRGGRVRGAGGCPTVGAGIVSPAGVQMAGEIASAPDDHFAAGPHGCVTGRAAGALVVLVAVQLSVLGLYLPPLFKRLPPSVHPRRSFRCRSRLQCERSAEGALVVLVAVQLSVVGSYLPPVFDSIGSSAPDDHFTAGPHRRVIRAQWAHWWCSWLSNCPCWDCIFRRYSHSAGSVFRPRRSFHCRSTLQCGAARAEGALVVLVAVQLLVTGFTFRRRTNLSTNPPCRGLYRLRHTFWGSGTSAV